MFRASSCPSSGAYQLQLLPLVYPLEHGGSSVVGHGSNSKPEAATAVDKLLMMGMRMPATC